MLDPPGGCVGVGGLLVDPGDWDTCLQQSSNCQGPCAGGLGVPSSLSASLELRVGGPWPGAADPREGIGLASVGFSFGFGCCAWTFSSCCYWGVSPAARTDFSLLSPLLSQSMDSSVHGAQ